MDVEPAEFRLSTRSVLAALLVADVLLVVLHVVSQWLRFHGEATFGRAFEATELLDLDAEVSLPTWWQQVVLVAAALLAAAIARIARARKSGDGTHWLGLAVVFLIVSIDEGTEIHERLIAPMRSTFDITGGPLWFAWLIPGIGLLLIFLLVYVRFWLGLVARVRAYVGLAGVLYLVGAVGFEMVGGVYESSRGLQDFGYAVVIAGEEGFELLGQAVLVAGLLIELGRRAHPGGVRVLVDGGAASGADA